MFSSFSQYLVRSRQVYNFNFEFGIFYNSENVSERVKNTHHYNFAADIARCVVNRCAFTQ